MTPEIIALAFLWDALLGDPPRWPHPVRLIGAIINRLEFVLRLTLPAQLKLAGVLLAALVSLGAWTVGLLIVSLIEQVKDRPKQAAGYLGSIDHSPELGSDGFGQTEALLALVAAWPEILALLALIYLSASTIATRELLSRVREVLNCEDLPKARELLAHIVGRDTAELDADGVRRAALESLAENASDGIVAPLFYLGLGGLPLALAYKAINTLDSMVGYRNEKYRELGWASARLDDLCNYLPARITAVLIIVASCLLAAGRWDKALQGWRIMRRDGRKHASPNSGLPEAALAGVLGIKLGGPAKYFGKIVEKPYIGDQHQAELREVSGVALRIILLSSLLALLLAMTIAML